MKLVNSCAAGLIGLLACAAAKAEIILEEDNRISYMAADRINTGLNVSVLLVP